MKKINLKKVNKNTLCNVLIAVNVGTLVLDIINSKKKNKVATEKDIDDKIEICHIDTFKYVDSKLDEIDDKIERIRIDAFRYTDNKLGEINDKIERFRVDAFRYVDNKLDGPRLKPNPYTTDTTAPIIFDQKTCTTTTGSEPVYVRDTDFK